MEILMIMLVGLSLLASYAFIVGSRKQKKKKQFEEMLPDIVGDAWVDSNNLRQKVIHRGVLITREQFLWAATLLVKSGKLEEQAAPQTSEQLVLRWYRRAYPKEQSV
ncbi:MAG: hypothetical protein JWO73_271 [Candidatus Taylorbacteria bacterium]|nr:hypothetical protein [Candidatus Taylorbacteria bacterium]